MVSTILVEEWPIILATTKLLLKASIGTTSREIPTGAVHQASSGASRAGQRTGPEKQKTRQTLRSDGPEMSARDVEVPGPGIEPGTRGFSGLVREWPRPRDPLEKQRVKGAGEADLCQPDAGSEGQLSLFVDDK